MMIPSYIGKWLTIIEKMNNDNTYKLAWGRAIVECVNNEIYKKDESQIIIEFKDIAKLMVKYYWNQLFFFNLKQSPYLDREPVISKLTRELIELYKVKKGSNLPIWFNEGYEVLIKEDKKLVEDILKKVERTLHENVAWRFKRTDSGVSDIYEYDKKGGRILIEIRDSIILKEYSVIISRLLNYKWAQLLEKYNFAPKIISKINGLSDNKVRRNNLKKFKDALLKEFEGGKAIDFYSGEVLSEDDISVDHVIPWSFMFSDDIWNLVLTSKSNNSSKSNSIPSSEIIMRLKKRNERLEEILDGNYKLELEEAIKNNYVDKFYFESRI